MTAGSGGGARGYTILSGVNGTSLMFFGSGENPGNNRLDFSVTPHNNAATITLTVYVAAQGGWVSSGEYTDNIYLKVFNRKGSQIDFAGYRDFSVRSFVLGTCNLPPPDQPTLNFTSAFSGGLPNGMTLSVTFSGVSCSAPARLRLSGEPLINPGIAPAANFDNFIDWQADATFGAAHVVLDTRVTNQATSGSRNVASGSTLAGVITLFVKLLAGHRVIAGHYSNVLTVTIDPAI